MSAGGAERVITVQRHLPGGSGQCHDGLGHERLETGGDEEAQCVVLETELGRAVVVGWGRDGIKASGLLAIGNVLYLFVRGVRPDWVNADGTHAGVFQHRPTADTLARRASLERLKADLKSLEERGQLTGQLKESVLAAESMNSWNN